MLLWELLPFRVACICLLVLRGCTLWVLFQFGDLVLVIGGGFVLKALGYWRSFLLA